MLRQFWCVRWGACYGYRALSDAVVSFLQTYGQIAFQLLLAGVLLASRSFETLNFSVSDPGRFRPPWWRLFLH